VTSYCRPIVLDHTVYHRSCGLLQVPVAVETLKDRLRTLDVSNNRLTELPGFVADFSALRTLACSSNNLSKSGRGTSESSVSACPWRDTGVNAGVPDHSSPEFMHRRGCGTLLSTQLFSVP